MAHGMMLHFINATDIYVGLFEDTEHTLWMVINNAGGSRSVLQGLQL